MATATRERTTYPPEWAASMLFEDVTRRALSAADEEPLSPAVARALRSLEDIRTDGWDQERNGATYKSLSYAARQVGADRREFLSVAERLGLTQKHVGHIIARAEDKKREVREQAETGPATPPPRSQEPYDDPAANPFTFWDADEGGYEYIPHPDSPQTGAEDAPKTHSLKVGDRVHHKKLGSGTVTRAGHHRADVELDRDGSTRYFVPALAPMEKIEDPQRVIELASRRSARRSARTRSS